MERLDKLLANTGRWSRKETHALIKAGRVRVEGVVARAKDQKVPPEANLTVDGEPLGPPGPTWLMLHKPQGVVSSTEDPRERTVLSLLPEQFQRLGLFPVGRLDKDTTGLLLLTDDGPLAHALLSPRRHVDKVYAVEVAGTLDGGDVAAFAAGLTLSDGYTCLPALLEPTGPGQGLVTLREGKYHQVKRMCAARGKPVTRLERVQFGPLTLDRDLLPGRWRPLTGEEIALLRRAGGTDA